MLKIENGLEYCSSCHRCVPFWNMHWYIDTNDGYQKFKMRNACWHTYLWNSIK